MVTQVPGGYADIYAWENLYSAWRKAARGGASPLEWTCAISR
jgi:hypothetical protein